MAHEVRFSPESEGDLLSLYDLLAERAGPEAAYRYTEGLRAFRLGVAEFPERGTRRDDLRPGLHSVGFHLAGNAVVIDRLLYGGRNWAGLLGEEGD